MASCKLCITVVRRGLLPKSDEGRDSQRIFVRGISTNVERKRPFANTLESEMRASFSPSVWSGSAPATCGARLLRTCSMRMRSAPGEPLSRPHSSSFTPSCSLARLRPSSRVALCRCATTPTRCARGPAYVCAGGKHGNAGQLTDGVLSEVRASCMLCAQLLCASGASPPAVGSEQNESARPYAHVRTGVCTSACAYSWLPARASPRAVFCK